MIAGSSDDIDAKKADITLKFEEKVPVKLIPKDGASFDFQGEPASYTPNPFMMVMEKGQLLKAKAAPTGEEAASAPQAGRAVTGSALHKKRQPARAAFFICALDEAAYVERRSIGLARTVAGRDPSTARTLPLARKHSLRSG